MKMNGRSLRSRFFAAAAWSACAWSTLALPAALHAQSQTATTTPIQHVVVIFQENVSFDHYFATYPNAANNTSTEPAFRAAANTPSINGLSGPLLTANPNSAQPFRLTRAQAVTCDQDHNYLDEQKAFDQGLMDKFVETLGCNQAGIGKKIVMGYYDGNTVTAFWNYAQAYAMSDNSFSTTFGPSTPGVLSLIAGQTHGATVTAGNPSGNVSAGSVIGDPRPDPSLDDCTLAPPRTYITMSGKNVGDLLNANNITWGFFQGGFRPTLVKPDGTAVCGAHHTGLSGDDAVTTSGDYIPHHQGFQYFKQTSNPHHLSPSSPTSIGKTDQANHQYDLADFFSGLSAGVMPAVTYLKAGAYQDGHAGYSNPLDEQIFVVNTINTIMKSPFWNSTAIVIAYDDSDGWYDHVIGPIVNQSATPDDNLTGPGSCGTGTSAVYQGRCGYGPRQPLLVISPYAKVNYVDHTVTDLSSILRFIEDNWSLGRIGDNSADAIAGPLTGMFNFQNNGATAALILDPNSGNPTSATPVTPGTITQAIANPKSTFTTLVSITLDATASTSANGQPLTYLWTSASTNQPVLITGAGTTTPTVTFLGSVGVYTFILTVTDTAGNTSTDTVSVTKIR
jgi:phospholipase C